MATIDSPSQPSTSVEVEPTFKAMRTVQRPIEYIGYGGGGQQTVGGHYKVSSNSGGFLFTTSAQLITFRHTNPNTLSVLLRVHALVTATATIAAQDCSYLQLILQRPFTADPTTNAVTISGLSTSAVRSTMPPPSASIKIASAAAGMSGQTASIGATVGITSLNGLTTAGTGPEGDLYNYLSGTIAHPLVFAANEGFEIIWGTLLAGGSARAAFVIEWAEVPEF